MNSVNNFSHLVNYKHDPAIHNFSAAKQVLPFLLKLKPVDSILDIGCGTGTWLAIAKELGVKETIGVDGVDLSPEDLKIPVDNFIKRDLTGSIDLNKKFDMLLCLEVAEHLPEEFAKTLIDTLTRHSDFIIFSAAIPGQGGQNHLNEQWPDYWQKLFYDKGYYPSESLRYYLWNNKQIEWWYRQNIMIYAPKDILTVLNLPISEEVKSLIHPDLFEEKLQLIDRLNGAIEREVWTPTFKSAFKKLIKSIVH
ncbi:MAG TPA: class I SAM-dependent methyltransferase [Mucilaginibacter sp.]